MISHVFERESQVQDDDNQRRTFNYSWWQVLVFNSSESSFLVLISCYRPQRSNSNVLGIINVEISNYVPSLVLNSFISRTLRGLILIKFNLSFSTTNISVP